MKDELKGKFFRDLMSMEIFRAQTQLEDDLLTTYMNRLLTIDLSKDDVQLEYAKTRGSIEVLKQLKTTRERLIEIARSRE